MNILYISPRLPYPPDQGDKVVIYNHIKFLSRENRITLLSFIQDEAEMDGISNLSDYCARIEVFKKRPNLSVLNFIRAVYRQEPFTAIRYYSPKMLRRSKELIESGRFDVVHAAFYYIGRYAVDKDISVPKNTAVILDTHNVEYLIYSRYARLAKKPVIKLLIWLESLRIKRYELPMYKRFDRCIAFSELDKKNIAELSQASNIAVLPACIEVSKSQSVRVSEDGRDRPVPQKAGLDPSLKEGKVYPLGLENPTYPNRTILFFGLLNTPANDDAIRFFYEKIFPLIKKEASGVKFVIAGKYPTRYIANLARDPSVDVLGRVSDIRGLLEKVPVVVAPLRLGGGIRLKILEAWAAGKAVVSTSIGAEGVEVRGGEDIIIADSVSDFAKETVELLKDGNRRARLGQAAYRKVCEYYSPDRIIRNLERIYRETLEEKALQRAR